VFKVSTRKFSENVFVQPLLNNSVIKYIVERQKERKKERKGKENKKERKKRRSDNVLDSCSVTKKDRCLYLPP
jgi:hypothetical protein